MGSTQTTRTMKYATLLSALLISTLLPARPTDPAWKAATGAVDWLRTTSAGAIIACTNEGLEGVDPDNGTITWSHKDLANTPEAGFQEISNTPFVSVVPPGSKEDLIILEPFTGKLMFNSKDAGIANIANKYFLYENNAIILVGQKADRSAAALCVDMGTGKVRWTKDDSFSKLIACNSVGPDAMILSTLFFAYKLDANTGEELWKKSPDPSLEQLSGLAALLDKGGANLNIPMENSGVFITTPHAPGLCFMGVQSTHKRESTDSKGNKTTTTEHHTFVNAFDINDGSYAWSSPLEMKQTLGAIVPLERGLLVGAGDRRSVDLLDYRTGDGIWGKKGRGINVKGSLSGAVEIGDKVLLTSGGSNGVITLMNAQGEEVWKKPVKLKGVVQRVTLAGADVLVATDQEMDVIDLATGSSRLDKTFQGGAGLVATGTGNTYLFNTKDGLVYRMPKEGGAVEAFSSTPLSFQGKEAPAEMEYTGNGLVITSDQNIALVSNDGSIKYNTYFPAPRESGLTRALKYASAARAAYYTAAFGYTSAAFGAASQSIQVEDANSAIGKELTQGLSDMYGQAANAGMDATKRFFKEANERFKATTSTDNMHFVLTDAGKKEYVLHAIDKSTGQPKATIPLGSDKTPVYEVDAITNSVYLVEGGAVVGHTVE